MNRTSVNYTHLQTFLDMRRADPNQNLSYDGEFLTRANNHAIKRLTRKPDEAFALRVMEYKNEYSRKFLEIILSIIINSEWMLMEKLNSTLLVQSCNCQVRMEKTAT